MTFPATVPAAGTIHTENRETYIVRSGRWEKYKTPAVALAGDGAGDGGNTARSTDNFYCAWGRSQHMPTRHVRIAIGFNVATACNVAITFWGRRENKWLANDVYTEHDGQIRWADTGNGGSYHFWDLAGANGIYLGYNDATRKCQPNAMQFADITLFGMNAQNTLLTWKFYSDSVTGNVLIWSTARSVITSPITNLTGCKCALTDNSVFQQGRMDAEVY